MSRRNETPTLESAGPKGNANMALMSILSSSPLSSLNSYTTATANAASPHDHWVAGDNSSVVSHQNDHDRDNHVDDDLAKSPLEPKPQYYPAKQLPPELKEHCRVYLEEALPQQAIFLLDSLLSTRSSNSSDAAYCPPPSQISLLCSLVIHPDFTTRPKEADWPQISLQALVYLRDLLAVFGPINARFKEAVLFDSDTAPDSSLRLSQAGNGDSYIDDDQRGLVRLAPRYGTDSIWYRGRDFFSVVGWAFNCSLSSPERWKCWRRWLEFMLDLLENDLLERYRLDVDAGCDEMPRLRCSILASYLNQRCGRLLDHVMKALFADGNTTAASVFHEVWPKECKKKRRPQDALKKRKLGTINIEKGEYGGYLDDESAPSEPPTPQKAKSKSGRAEQEALDIAYIETIPLRKRLFSWVSYLCFSLGDNLAPIDITDLYEKFADRIKALPPPLFSAFINDSGSALRVDQQVEILQHIVFLVITPGALHPRKVDSVKSEQGSISPAILERCFLPYPAGTIQVEDNLKMSLALEHLLMIVWRHSEPEEAFSDNLTNAVSKGIEARRDKINKKKVRGRARGASAEELEARAALESSGARLRWLAEAILESVKATKDADADMVVEDTKDS